MRLCFGSYLAVLVSCKAVNVDNKQLCEALLHSVAPNYEFTLPDRKTPTGFGRMLPPNYCVASKPA